MTYDYTNNICVVRNSASSAASADSDTVDSIAADSVEGMGNYAPY